MEFECFKDTVNHDGNYTVSIHDIPEYLMPDVVDYLIRVYRLYDIKQNSKIVEVNI